jgi:hypothetical protein
MILAVILLAALAPAAGQTCSKIPAPAKQSFCKTTKKCCAAASTRRLGAAAGQGDDIDMGSFPMKLKGDKHMRSFASMKLEKKFPGVKMLDRWQRDGSVANIVKVTKRSAAKLDVKATNLYDVTDDDFHKTLLDDIKKTYTMKEFFAEKYPDDDWDDLDEMREHKGWTIGELMIHLYTVESPDIYRPMNKMLREATSMDDIDEYWQSYISVLYAGLKTHAPFVDVDTYRGVNDCTSLDVLHVGDEGVLPTFTSTSTSKGAAAGFAGGCTLLHFTGGGYDIKSYSGFPSEAELLVEPGRIYNIETAEEVDGNEKFDCVTKGDDNHVVDESADADGVKEVSCDDVTAAFGAKWETKYCPLGADCCDPPEPVTNAGADCCECCDLGGSCDGEVCLAEGEDFFCGATQGGADADDIAQFKEMIGCDAAVTLARTGAAAGFPAAFLAGAAAVSGASFLVFAVYFATKKTQTPLDGAEEPSLYEPLAA